MKIWRKSTLAALFLFCTMFFALSMTAAAEEVGGVWKANKGRSEPDASWSYDTETKTLTVSGARASLFDHENPAPWQEYEDDIDVLILNGDVIPEVQPKKRVMATIKDEFQWVCDMEAKTLVFSNQGQNPGEFPFTSYTYQQIPNELNSVTVEDGITSLGVAALSSSAEIGTIFLGKDVQASSERGIDVQTKYIVSEDNPWMTTYDDCLYTKDYQRLIGCPLNKSSIKFPKGLKVIGEFAFSQCQFKELIIPWGVTTLEPFSISVYSPTDVVTFDETLVPKVILPDTITTAPNVFSSREALIHFYYSKNNKVIVNALNGLTRELSGFKYGVMLDSVAEYYPEAAVVKTGWQEENGKKFYYNANGQKVSGWQKIGTAWYWFAADGSMGKNLWVKDYGSWYYLKADGVMATNQWVNDQGNYWVNGSGIMVSNNWIQVSGSWYYLRGNGLRAENQWIYARDKKWYYLGKGGVMLANTTTPDGCKVDKNGVWVR